MSITKSILLASYWFPLIKKYAKNFIYEDSNSSWSCILFLWVVGAQAQGVSQAWDTVLYAVFPNQCNVVFSQLGKETKSYNKKKITESKTNKKRYEK